jgi:hypothetical protein
MKRKRGRIWGPAGALLALALLAACDAGAGTAPTPTPAGVDGNRVSYDFREGEQGWAAGFADYPPGEEQFYELASGPRDLPTGAEPQGTGYMLAGNNHSDDLFMFLKRKLGPAEGIRPNTDYRLNYTIVLASNAPSGCLGVGGAPGEGVTLKAGGGDIEPVPVEQDGLYRLNVDKGEQTNSGRAAEAVGDIANGVPCEEAAAGDYPYVSLTREHEGQISARSSASGELWLLVGTDSGFEGLTTLYYQRIEVVLSAP